MDKKRDSNSQPTISVIIPTWNSENYLPTCLEHLSSQTNTDFEVILVDNGSCNFQAGKIPAQWLNLTINEISIKENKGFAFACNLGAKEANGKWLAFLNADAYPYPDWLEKFTEARKSLPQASAFGSYILQTDPSNFVDSTGDIYNFSGIAWKGYNKYPVSIAPTKPFQILSPCAAAAFYRRDVFLEIGGFDEDYFSYFEDVDLGFRLNLYGYSCYSIPDMRVRHVGSSSTGKSSNFALYHYHRNQTWTYYKNMPGILFWLYFPLYLLGVFLFILKYLLNRRGKVVIKAKLDAFKQLSKFSQKRKIVQHERRAGIKTINKMLNKNLFAPYLLGRKLRKYNKIHGIQ